ncbi:hypothetical protein [Siccirubricoccus phaeus]|uniref:hypothetical protein n=1 Tax=Siccirubricoccus phaeus TaxID=2595053 RepID=UPI0011F3175C|nr:hypothetical protein [Siccirubricoccus phaeus]
MVKYPSLAEANLHGIAAGAALRGAGVPGDFVTAIRTKALKTARKTTGLHATNREYRWQESTSHPQYGTEHDCKIIFVKLIAQAFCFDNAPPVPTQLSRVGAEIKPLGPDLKQIFEDQYLGHPIEPGTYRDSLLLERFDFNDLIAEGLNPKHGHSSFHLGHEDPTRKPKHTPDNTAWRTKRSNLIQGDMTLRESRIYFVKLIGRYFDLGEIQIEGEATAAAMNASASEEDLE